MGGFGAADIHRAMVAALHPKKYRLGTKVVAVREDALVLDGGETIKAEGAIDARGATNMSALELLYEARLERDYRFEAPHRVDRPVLVDATIDQGGACASSNACRCPRNGCSSPTSASPSAPSPTSRPASGSMPMSKARGWARPRALAEQAGRGRCRSAATSPLSGGSAGRGRPSSACAAASSIRSPGGPWATRRAMALLLSRQRDFSGGALHDLFEAEAKQLWKKRELLRASPPRSPHRAGAAARPAQRLYRLDSGVAQRLQADRLGLLDRGRMRKALRLRPNFVQFIPHSDAPCDIVTSPSLRGG